jgi:hypothetical protein
MRYQSLSSLFKKHRSDPPTHKDPQPRQWSSEPTRCESDCNNSVSSPSLPKTCHVEATAPPRLAAYLPHTLIISDLGTWGRTFQLRFSHFLPQDPSVAVFSVSQKAPVPSTWPSNQAKRPWRVNIRCRWKRGCLEMRRSCASKVIVGSGWQYSISSSALRHWSAPSEVLLVDLYELYDDYFAQERKEKNRERVGRIVENFQYMEGQELVKDTGSLWSSYRRWDLFPAMPAEVALACSYENRTFEKSLVSQRRRVISQKPKVWGGFG